MATTGPNVSFEELSATTLKNYRKKLTDNFTDNIALFAQMRAEGFFEEDEGGTSIVVPISYRENSTVQTYHDLDLINITPQRFISVAEYDWKQLIGSYVISGREEFVNSATKTRVINLMEAKLTHLKESMIQVMEAQVFGDGSGNSGKDFTGLALAVEEGSAWSVYGGIDSSDANNAFWRNNWVDFNATYTSFNTAHAGSGSVEGLVAMTSVWNSCVRGRLMPTLIVTTQALFEAFEHRSQSFAQITVPNTRSKLLAQLGFSTLIFKDTPMIWTPDCPSQSMYFLNSNCMKFIVGRGRNFKVTPFKEHIQQEGKVAHVILYGNLVTLRRECNGVITDFVA